MSIILKLAFSEMISVIAREYMNTMTIEMDQQVEPQESPTDELRERNFWTHLFGLICRIHRDDGSYIQKHGVHQAATDADDIVEKLYHDRDALRELYKDDWTNPLELVSRISKERDAAIAYIKSQSKCHKCGWPNPAGVCDEHEKIRATILK